MTYHDIEKLTKAEKLRTMEALWDALQHDGAEADSPDWHGNVLADRQQKISEKQADFLNLNELKEVELCG